MSYDETIPLLDGFGWSSFREALPRLKASLCEHDFNRAGA